MNNWIELKNNEYNEVWDRFYNMFNFNPSVHEWDWPSFKEPKPFITYNISHIYHNPEFDILRNDLEMKAIMALRECVEQEEFIYALDWHHTCYWFNPWLDNSKKCPKHPSLGWVVPILPNGDYYIFLQKDFKWGILGHPWEMSMCIFGEKLIKSFEVNKPLLYKDILRSSL